MTDTYLRDEMAIVLEMTEQVVARARSGEEVKGMLTEAEFRQRQMEADRQRSVVQRNWRNKTRQTDARQTECDI